MGLLRWFTKNWADTREGTHADLKPLTLSGTPAECLTTVRGVIQTLKRFEVVSADEAAGKVHAVYTTGVVGYKDDIHLTFEAAGGGTLMHARGQSRVGQGDLGQNRRTLKKLFAAIAARTGTAA